MSWSFSVASREDSDPSDTVVRKLSKSKAVPPTPEERRVLAPSSKVLFPRISESGKTWQTQMLLHELRFVGHIVLFLLVLFLYQLLPPLHCR